MSGSEAVPVRVTVSPSEMVRSSPAEAVGAVLGGGTSVTVIVTWSVVVALWLSVTLRVKVMAVSVSTWGAVVNEGASVPLSDMDRPGWSEVQP